MHNSPPEAEASNAPENFSTMAWLKLLRLPTVFTSISNILCGYLITANTRQLSAIAAESELWLLILCSSCLYLSGMVLNDAFDAQLDAVERPERPIPSGAVPKSHAFAFGYLLLAIGIVAAVPIAGNSSLLIAIGIACSVILYDALLKNTKAAALGMAVCRFLNLLLGCSAAINTNQLLTFDNPALPVAIGLAIYVFGVTVFAMNEAGRMSTAGLVTGAVIAIGGIGIHLFTAGRMYQATNSSAAVGCLLIVCLLMVNILFRVIVAIRSRQSRLLQKTVGFMLLNIIFFDAAMTFCLTGSSQLAACILILVIPATLLKKVLPLS